MLVRPPRAPDRQVADRLLVSCAVHVHEPGRYDDEPALGNALLLLAAEDDEARPADKVEELLGRVPVRARPGSGVEETAETHADCLWPPWRSSACVPGR